jgi:hypothetical protein
MHDGTRFLERPYSPEQGKVMEQGVQKTRYLVTRILTPAIFRIKEIHCEMIAQLRIVQAGLALLQYKQANNALPSTLEELKLPNINDPFSDKTLLYKTEGQGFVLYSVGPDQVNNGGSPRQKKQKEDWDIVWNFPDKS